MLLADNKNASGRFLWRCATHSINRKNTRKANRSSYLMCDWVCVRLFWRPPLKLFKIRFSLPMVFSFENLPIIMFIVEWPAMGLKWRQSGLPRAKWTRVQILSPSVVHFWNKMNQKEVKVWEGNFEQKSDLTRPGLVLGLLPDLNQKCTPEINYLSVQNKDNQLVGPSAVGSRKKSGVCAPVLW